MADIDYAFHLLKTPGTVTASFSGLGSAPSLEGAGLTSIDDGFGTYLEHATPAAQNSPAGLITSFDVLAAGWRPTIEFEVQVPIDLTNLRFWIGLFSQRPDLLSPSTGLPGAHVAAFYFEPPQGNWRAVTSNLAQLDDLPTPVPVLLDARYRLRIEIDGGSPPTEVKFFVNDLASPQATSGILPDLSKLLGIGLRVVNPVDNVAKKIRWNRASWKYKVRLT